MDRHSDTIEKRREEIQAELDSLRSATERNRLGQFATPRALAMDVARYVDSIAANSLRSIRFGDPCIGTGSFYSAALAVFGRGRIEDATGVELDPAFCEAARSLWKASGLQVICGDFTRMIDKDPLTHAPNLILTNPPYVRHHHLERTEKERLQALVRRTTGIEVSGLAGLYVYFLILATSWMQDSGYAAWLIPSEFMDVNYGTALKRFLVDRVTLIRVHRFDPADTQFSDALVSSVVLVFRKTAPKPGHTVEVSLGGTLAAPRAVESVSSKSLRESRKWTGHPRHSTNDRRGSGLTGPRLGDFFRVQRGIATGANKFFVLERAEAERRRFPAECLRPILPSPRQLGPSIIEADETGYPLLDPQFCVIDCNLSERVLRTRYPSLWSYFESAEALGVKEGYLVGKRNPWYRQEQREPAPFLCTYMGRGSDQKQPFRFLWNRSRAIATNVYLMLYPREALATMLRREPDRAAILFTLLTDVTGYELRSEGRVYGGGLNKIEPRELARISATSFVDRWPELKAQIPGELQLLG